MKYLYYNNQNLGTYLSTGKHIEDIEKDAFKVIIFRDGQVYHVLEMENGTYKEEMRTYSFYDLTRHLRFNEKNIYFLNDDREDASMILYESREDRPYKYGNNHREDKPIYTVSDGKVLKVRVAVQNHDLATAIKDCYTAELLEEPSKFKRVSLEELAANKELQRIYHFPIKTVNDKFVVPQHEYSSPNLFYVLSSMYQDEPTFIPLSEQDLRNLYMFSYSKYSDIVAKVISSIVVTKVEEYDLNGLEDSVKQLERFKENEKDHDLQLDNVNKIIKKAKQNEPVFANLHLLETREERKARQLQKETTN